MLAECIMVAGGLYPGIFKLYKTASAAIASVTMSRVPAHLHPCQRHR